jgi:hypothetical protein
MTSWSRIAALPVAAIATSALAGCGGDKATLTTFTGTWQGHGRTLNITRNRLRPGQPLGPRTEPAF